MSLANQFVPIEQLRATTVEGQVISLLLANPRTSKVVALALLTMEDFTVQRYRIIFAAITGIAAHGAEYEVFAVIEMLRQSHQLDGVGGPAVVMQLYSRAFGDANLEKYCRILNEYRAKRRLLGLVQSVVQSLSQHDDVFDCLSSAEKQLSGIQQGFVNTSITTLKGAALDLVKQLIDRRENPRQARVQFGIKSLDKTVGILEGGDVVVIGARPGMGKTDIVIHWAAHNAIKNKLPGIIFSLEMKATQLAARALAETSGIAASDTRGDLSTEDLHKLAITAENMENSDLVVINDTPSHTLSSLRAAVIQTKARLQAEGHDLYWVALDYVQLLKGTGKKTSTTDEDTKEVSIGLKAFAKEMNVVLLELAQLGREVDKRSPPVPTKSDLRASAQIEMDADVLVLLYRPSAYANLKVYEDSEGVEIPAQHLETYVEFIVDKNRHNRPGVAVGKYLPAESRFDVYPEASYQSFPVDFSKPQHEPF